MDVSSSSHTAADDSECYDKDANSVRATQVADCQRQPACKNARSTCTGSDANETLMHHSFAITAGNDKSNENITTQHVQTTHGRLHDRELSTQGMPSSTMQPLPSVAITSNSSSTADAAQVVAGVPSGAALMQDMIHEGKVTTIANTSTTTSTTQPSTGPLTTTSACAQVTRASSKVAQVTTAVFPSSCRWSTTDACIARRDGKQLQSNNYPHSLHHHTVSASTFADTSAFAAAVSHRAEPRGLNYGRVINFTEEQRRDAERRERRMHTPFVHPERKTHTTPLVHDETVNRLSQPRVRAAETTEVAVTHKTGLTTSTKAHKVMCLPGRRDAEKCTVGVCTTKSQAAMPCDRIGGGSGDDSSTMVTVNLSLEPVKKPTQQQQQSEQQQHEEAKQYTKMLQQQHQEQQQQQHLKAEQNATPAAATQLPRQKSLQSATASDHTRTTAGNTTSSHSCHVDPCSSQVDTTGRKDNRQPSTRSAGQALTKIQPPRRIVVSVAATTVTSTLPTDTNNTGLRIDKSVHPVPNSMKAAPLIRARAPPRSAALRESESHVRALVDKPRYHFFGPTRITPMPAMSSAAFSDTHNHGAAHRFHVGEDERKTIELHTTHSTTQPTPSLNEQMQSLHLTRATLRAHSAQVPPRRVRSHVSAQTPSEATFPSPTAPNYVTLSTATHTDQGDSWVSVDTSTLSQSKSKSQSQLASATSSESTQVMTRQQVPSLLPDKKRLPDKIRTKRVTESESECAATSSEAQDGLAEVYNSTSNEKGATIALTRCEKTSVLSMRAKVCSDSISNDIDTNHQGVSVVKCHAPMPSQVCEATAVRSALPASSSSTPSPAPVYATRRCKNAQPSTAHPAD